MKEFIGCIKKKETQILGQNSDIAKYRKEKYYRHSLICLAISEHGNIVTLMDCRFYYTPSRSYCCVWIHLPDFCLRGGAYAGGYGYHRDSASLAHALRHAGLPVLDLEGRGSAAMESALLELGQKLSDKFDMGLTNFTIIKADS